MIIICYSSLGEFLVSNVCLFSLHINHFPYPHTYPLFIHTSHTFPIFVCRHFFSFFIFHLISLTLIGVNVIPYLSSPLSSPLLSSFLISKTKPKKTPLDSCANPFLKLLSVCLCIPLFLVAKSSDAFQVSISLFYYFIIIFPCPPSPFFFDPCLTATVFGDFLV